MKISSLKPSLSLIAPLVALSIFGASHVAPAFAAPGTGRGAGRGRRAQAGMPAKMVTAIEAKTGKTLTPEQKTQLDAAADTRKAAVKAADSAFQAEVARVTGLSADDVKTLGRRPRTPKATTTVTPAR